MARKRWTCYLDERAYWQGVPQRVWEYTLGGYPVLKKWLSYREQDVLGRALTTGEVRHFAGMARRIAALLLLEPELDANYVRARAEAVAWDEITGKPPRRKLRSPRGPGRAHRLTCDVEIAGQRLIAQEKRSSRGTPQGIRRKAPAVAMTSNGWQSMFASVRRQVYAPDFTRPPHSRPPK